jgi:Ca2+/Na+ antiporter
MALDQLCNDLIYKLQYYILLLSYINFSLVEINEDISYFLINILKIVYYLHVIFLFNMQSDDNNHDILSYRVIIFL